MDMKYPYQAPDTAEVFSMPSLTYTPPAYIEAPCTCPPSPGPRTLYISITCPRHGKVPLSPKRVRALPATHTLAGRVAVERLAIEALRPEEV